LTDKVSRGEVREGVREMLRLAREALELSLFVAAIAPFAVRVREKARRSKHKNGLSLSLAAITLFPARAREKSRRSKRGAINETG
jgi:hypothetical protein